MAQKLRHSHIAVRSAIGSLATIAGASLSSGEDDLGTYSFFDLSIGQAVRFAAHNGDAMTHLLAERIDRVDDLTTALKIVGATDVSALSISRDRDGNPVRSIEQIKKHLSARMATDEPPSSRTARLRSSRT